MVTSKDHRWINVAKKFIKLSVSKRYKLCAVIVKGGRIISIGNNTMTAAPKPYQKKHRSNLALHAEIHALHYLPYESSYNATCYVYGETLAGNLADSLPCPSCMASIIHMGIKRVVYYKNKELQELRCK